MNTETMVADLLQITPLLVIWGAACLLLLGDVFLWKRNKEWNPLLAAGALLIALVLTFKRAMEVAEPTSPFAGGLRMDTLATVSTIVLLVTGFLSVLLSWTYLKNRNLDHGEYYVLLLLSVSGAILMAIANDLIVLFLGLEVLSFALYVMAGFARTEEKSEEASIKYFLLGAFASAFLLYGIALIYGATQTTDLHAIGRVVFYGAGATPMALAGTALLVVGLGFKAAVIPFHQWTPDVYEGAPTSVTAYMAGAAKIGAFAAMLRVFDSLIPARQQGLPFWLPAMQIVAILTMVVGNLLAVTQTNLKRMLAYSSIAHAGYLLVAVAALGHRLGPLGAVAHGMALSGALFYLFAYTFMTLGAFGVLIYLSGRGRDYQQVEDLRGLVRHDPKAAYAMMFFMLSLGGIPPTMGFMGKWQIFLAALQAHEYTLAIVMALASVIAVYYYLRVVWMMIFEEPAEEAPGPAVSRGPASLSLAIAVAATVVFGIMPGILMSLTTVR